MDSWLDEQKLIGIEMAPDIAVIQPMTSTSHANTHAIAPTKQRSISDHDLHASKPLLPQLNSDEEADKLSDSDQQQPQPKKRKRITSRLKKPVMSVFRHLRLLLWKNYVLQLRHPWVTIIELAIPCIFVAMLAAIRVKVKFTYHANNTEYEPFETLNVPELKFGENLMIPEWVLLYSPNTVDTNEIMTKLTEKLGHANHLLHFISIPFQNEDAMIKEYDNNTYYQNIILCAVLFDQKPNFNEELKFTLRFPSTPKHAANDPMRPIKTWWTQFTFPLFSRPGPRMQGNETGGVPGYWEEGFLAVQHALSMIVAAKVAHIDADINEDLIHVQMQRFPYPDYVEDDFLLALQFLFPFILMLSFIYPAVNLTKNLVIEKERRLKESMKMMGLKNWLHWLAWFIKSFVWLALSVALLAILITIKVKEGVGIMNKSDGFLIYLFFITYTISCIAFCFMLSTFFSKANVSAMGSGVIFFMAFMPYFFTFPRYRDLSFGTKIGTCFLSNSALSMGAMIISMHEGNNVGLRWSNIDKTASPDDTMTIQLVITMFIIDTFLYLLITWYVEAVFPGEYGVPQPWYFPIKRSYWFGKSIKRDESSEKVLNRSDVSNGAYSVSDKAEFFEKEPSSLKCGIRIADLSKTFDKKKFAVKNLHLNAYDGQITALLGHNGAGKTTTMSILTGLFPPSSGTAYINGFDIRTDINTIRSNLGICPQFDILFDELTVEEHLYFYCKLKNFDATLVEDEITKMVEMLGLVDKRKKQSKTLSGGMKRKLSVGMALVGDSKIVILDEPTSGMDVSARRFTWDLLIGERADRCILLSTHFMEEADVLGDRIAIMANGELQCCGSPLFLKRRYGAGYHMTIVKKDDTTDERPITSLIQHHIPHAKLDTHAGAEIGYSLPSENSSLFEALFTELETKKAKLGVESYGASITTMEEVFLKVGEYAEEGIKAINESVSNHNNNLHNNNDVSLDLQPKSDATARNTGLALAAQQFRGLMMKKILFSIRNPVLTLSQLLILMAFAILILILIRDLPKPGDSPQLVLNVAKFKGTRVPVFYAKNQTDSDFVKSFTSNYVSQFTGDDVYYEQPFDAEDLQRATIDYYISELRADMNYINLHMPIGVIIESNHELEHSLHAAYGTITALFNNQPFHSPGITLAAADQAVMRIVTNNSEYRLEVVNHPLPRTTADKLLQVQYQNPEQFQIAENVMFSMSFLAASFAVFLVKERAIKAKHLQQVCGVKLYIFWITAYIWDFLTYIIPCLLVMLMYWAFDHEPLRTPEQEMRIFIIFVVHGLAMLPFVYALSFLFDVPSTAYVRLCLFNIIVGIGAFITVAVTELPLLDLMNVSKILDWIFSLFIPNFCLGRALFNIYTNYLGNKYCNIAELQEACNLGTINATKFINMIKTEYGVIHEILEQYPQLQNLDGNITIPIPEVIKPCCKDQCEDNCFPWNANFFGFERPGIGRLMIILCCQAVICWVVIIKVEMNVFRNMKYLLLAIKSKLMPRTKAKSNSDGETNGNNAVELTVKLDEDVRAEYDRIDKTAINKLFDSDTLIIKNLTKYYDDFCAVDHISYGVRRGECFGLLGINGAGKTTTFKMITGDETISSGDIFVNTFNVKSNIKQVLRQIGYCPQFDGLLDQLTGRETLTLFSRLRGLPEYEIPRHIDQISKLLYFDMHIDKLVRNYSGGTKRKLSTALAILGDPPVTFLDEPTTGVDPVARRCLWDALTKKLNQGTSIILTSHSMEECEALCNRLIIMVNGKICCIGSPQQLKNKFGKGYTVIIKVAAGTWDNKSDHHVSVSSRRPSKMAWRQNSTVSNDIVLANNIKEVKAFMEKRFPCSELKAIHNNQLHFFLNDTELLWAKIFGLIEREKERLNIEDYSIGQTTLEQIFLTFARQQREIKE